MVPRKFRGVSFDRPPVPDLDPIIVDAVREYIADLDSNIDEGRGLWFMGDVGTGKTTLAMLVSKATLEAGYSVAIYSLPKLLTEIRKTYDQSSDNSYPDFQSRLAAVDLLHIDDVGAERQTDWVLEQLYALINERYETRRAVMITTNLNPEQLNEQIGDRTVSRLIEICSDPLPLHGPDLRKLYPAV